MCVHQKGVLHARWCAVSPEGKIEQQASDDVVPKRRELPSFTLCTWCMCVQEHRSIYFRGWQLVILALRSVTLVAAAWLAHVVRCALTQEAGRDAPLLNAVFSLPNCKKTYLLSLFSNEINYKPFLMVKLYERSLQSYLLMAQKQYNLVSVAT